MCTALFYPAMLLGFLDLLQHGLLGGQLGLGKFYGGDCIGLLLLLEAQLFFRLEP